MFDRQALEEALRELSEVPRTRVTVPHSLAIPELLRETDMLSIVPASLAVALAKHGDLLRRPPPTRRGPRPSAQSGIAGTSMTWDTAGCARWWPAQARLTEEALG